MRGADSIKKPAVARASRLGPSDAEGQPIDTYKRAIRPRAGAQTRYVETLRKSKLTFSIGPAGTGKTFLAVAVAVEMMKRRQVERIILSRPAVEAGERRPQSRCLGDGVAAPCALAHRRGGRRSPAAVCGVWASE